MLSMSQAACDKYISVLKDGGMLMLDSTFVQDVPKVDAKILSLPITKTAKEELGHAMFANIIALGALVGATNMVTEAALTEAVLDRIPKGTEEKNQKALSLGLALGKAQQ